MWSRCCFLSAMFFYNVPERSFLYLMTTTWLCFGPTDQADFGEERAIVGRDQPNRTREPSVKQLLANHTFSESMINARMCDVVLSKRLKSRSSNRK